MSKDVDHRIGFVSNLHGTTVFHVDFALLSIVVC
jgi:hypothetical protein